ncbi:MAG: pyridoxal phosphate-dependent aminotransferase [Lentisphaerae bacterium]|nr:pyridoxal phosphate-dependent aminotransferase [Lentisphaerota bacterium]
MRSEFVHDGIKNLHYEIREIVDYGHALQKLGVEISWENIGDPVAAGEEVEPWIKEIVMNLMKEDATWAYCPSRGILKTREFLADIVSNRPNSVKVGPNDILFFNGIADAVDKIYDLIKKDDRVMMPSPSYPTHTSNEGKRGDYSYLQFKLDPVNNWQPDLEEIENMVKYNPQVVAISIVNPDNPTGAVYTRKTLDGIVDIARRYGIFIICDEIYAHICYNGAETLHLSQILGEVPGLALRGISKDVPWPGARCGWVEMLNSNSSTQFREYCDGLIKSKMMEVCSTTLPQLAIPEIYGDPRYMDLKERRAKMFERRSNQVYEYFKENVPGTIVRPTQGAFYFSVAFEDGVLNDKQTLPIKDSNIREFVEQSVRGVQLDKRFVHYMMASEGVCVTPLTGFHTDIQGFRLTTLDPDDDRRTRVLERIGNSIKRYIGA